MSAPLDKAVLGWGIVGTGGIAHKVGSDIARLADGRIAAVSSRSVARATDFAAAMAGAAGGDGRVPHAHGSVDALVADEDVDIVYVATPHSHHHDAARRALVAGKAVLCEKAFTVTLAEAEDLVAIARERQVFLMEAMWMRFDPLVLAARELARNGAIGEVLSVSANIGFAPPYDPTHRLFDPATGGGAALDVTVYPLSLVQFVLGTPESSVVHGALAPNGVDIEETLLLRYPGGRTGHVYGTLRGLPDRTATISGSAGWLRLGGPHYAPPTLTIARGFDEPEVRTGPAEESYLPQLQAVHDAVRAGRTESALMPWSDTLDVMTILTDALDQLGVQYPTPTPTPELP